MPRKKDFIFLKGLETRCVIGIFDWERRVRQRILIDLAIPIDARRAARHDRIADAVNYKAVAKRLLQAVPKTRFQLVESLGEFVAGLCLKEFGLREVTVRLSKPGAIRGAENVGIEITRKKGQRSSPRRGRRSSRLFAAPAGGPRRGQRSSPRRGRRYAA